MTDDEIRKLAGSLAPLRPGAPDGPAMRAWRRILARHAQEIGRGAAAPAESGRFDPEVERWTLQFQSDAHLARLDSVVGPMTWAAALRRYPEAAAALATAAPQLRAARPAPAKRRPGWPEQGRARLSEAERTARFGEPGQETEIVAVMIPELVGIPGAPDNGLVRAHRLAAPLLAEVFAAWRREGLLAWVLSFNGSYQARRQRAKAGAPPDDAAERPWSGHAFGIAFDINADWNLVGLPPAGPEERGSVLRLVETAERCGFWWGGFDAGRPDGSHFEVGGAPVARAAAAEAPAPPAPVRAARTAPPRILAVMPVATRKVVVVQPQLAAARKAAAKKPRVKSTVKAAPAKKAAATRKPVAGKRTATAAKRGAAPKGKGRR